MAEVEIMVLTYHTKDLEGSGCGLIKALYQHLPGGTEENKKNPQSGQMAFFTSVEDVFNILTDGKNRPTYQ
jgi:hypothetical protein